MSLARKIDWFYFWYFLIHIPITILVDSCLIIPKSWQTPLQVKIVEFHIHLNKDFLLETLPLWLKVFGFLELTFQLPLFFYGAIQLYKNSKTIYVWLIIYGFNASLTTAVCLAYAFAESETNGLSSQEMWGLIGLYVPYFVIPFFMLVDSTKRVLNTIEGTKKKID